MQDRIVKNYRFDAVSGDLSNAGSQVVVRLMGGEIGRKYFFQKKVKKVVCQVCHRSEIMVVTLGKFSLKKHLKRSEK